jgi:hypothetical protein
MHHPLRCYLQWSWPCHTLPGLPSLPYKSCLEAPWPCHSCILCGYKTSSMWTMPRSSTSSNSICVPLDYGWLLHAYMANPRKYLPMWIGYQEAFLSESLPEEFTILHLAAYEGKGLGNSWNVPKTSFLWFQCKRLGLSLMILITLRTTLCSSQLSTISFSARLYHFQVFSLFFLLLILTIILTKSNQ